MGLLQTRLSLATRSRATFWLACIVLLGAALRLFPVWFGLPYLHARPDEEAATWHAMAVVNGDLNPHFFHWPSLTFYLFAGLFTAASWIRRALFLDPALPELEQLIIARTFVALAGTLTIVVMFRLARRVADTTTGLLAALFIAVAVLHVRDSHFAMTDVLMTLLVTASLVLLMRAVDTGPSGSSRWFAAAGLSGGLAASTKYSAAAVIAGMGAAQLLLLARGEEAWRKPQAWRPPVIFLAAFGIGFLIATPYALLDFHLFAADLRFDFAHLSGGQVLNAGRGWSYHLTHSLPYGVGVPTCIAAVAGIVPMLRHYRRRAFVIVAFSAAFYAWIGSGETVFFRYILPLVPIVCLAAAVAVRHAAPWLASHTRLSSQTTLALLTVLVAGPALVNSAWLDILLARTDTRVLAGRWLAPRLKAEESLYDAGGVFAQLYLPDAPVHRWRFDAAASVFYDAEGRTPDWLVLPDSPLWTYATVPLGLRRLALEKYVLVHVVEATKEPAGEAAGRAGSAVYDLDDAFFMPVSGFRTIERPGPTVSIYRRADAAPVGSPGP
jgi:hypothetical protein